MLCSVPETSNHHVAARLAAADVRVRGRRAAPELAEDDLVAAGGAAGRTRAGLRHAGRRRRERLLDAPRSRGCTATADGAGGAVLGCPLTENDLRVALESCYRTLARHADNTRERIALVDSANQIRPRTWV